jgi:anti-repressor protein
MNELIRIDVSQSNEQIVSARSLHEALGVSKRFSTWWEDQVQRLSLIENKS